MADSARAIPFTQYLRPDGRREIVHIDVPGDVAAKADKIIEEGYRLECEVLTTGQISLTIFDPDEEVDLAIKICANGPGVRERVCDLINGFELNEAA